MQSSLLDQAVALSKQQMAQPQSAPSGSSLLDQAVAMSKAQMGVQPQQSGGGFVQGVKDFGQSMAQGITQGVANLGALVDNRMSGIGNPINNTANSIMKRAMPTAAPAFPNRQNINAVGLFDGNAPDPTVAAIGESVPYMIAPEVRAGSALADVAGSGVPYVSKAVNAMAPYANTFATGATYGAINDSATQNPSGSNSNSSNWLVSGLVPTIAQGVIGAPAKAIGLGLKSIAKNANDVTGVLTPAQAAAKSADIGNAPVSLGDFINHPGLSKLYNDKQTVLPGSGISSRAQQVAALPTAQANSIDATLLGNTAPENITKEVAKGVQQNYKSRTALARTKYQPIIQDADSTGFNLGSIPNLKGALQELGDDAASLPPALKGFVAQYNNDVSPSIVSSLKSYGLGSGAESPEVSFQEAHTMQSKLGKMAAQASLNPNTQGQAAILKSAQKGLQADIMSALKSHSPDLADKYQGVSDWFRDEVGPYRDNKAIFATATGVKDNPYSLSNVFQKGETDDVRKVYNDLSPEHKNLVLADLFSGARYNTGKGGFSIDPDKQWKEYAKLDPDQLDRLTTPQLQQEFNKLNYLNQVAKGPSHAAKHSGLMKLGGLGGAAYAATKVGATPAAAMIGGGVLANRAIARGLESPQLKQAYINQSLDRLTQPNSIPGRAVNVLNYLARPQMMPMYINAFNSGSQGQ